VKLHKAAHTVYKTQYHIVWVTRFRRKILVEGVATYLQVKLRTVQKSYPDWHFTEIGIDKDHVHVHMVIPPKYSVSFAVETIKKNTSRALREKFRFWTRCTGIAAESGQRGTLYLRLGLPKRSSDGTWLGKVRKTRDKHSLNSERTPPVKAGESMIPSSDLPKGRPSDAYRQPDLAGRLAHPESNLLRDTFRIGICTK